MATAFSQWELSDGFASESHVEEDWSWPPTRTYEAGRWPANEQNNTPVTQGWRPGMNQAFGLEQIKFIGLLKLPAPSPS